MEVVERARYEAVLGGWPARPPARPPDRLCPGSCAQSAAVWEIPTCPNPSHPPVLLPACRCRLQQQAAAGQGLKGAHQGRLPDATPPCSPHPVGPCGRPGLSWIWRAPQRCLRSSSGSATACQCRCTHPPTKGSPSSPGGGCSTGGGSSGSSSGGHTQHCGHGGCRHPCQRSQPAARGNSATSSGAEGGCSSFRGRHSQQARGLCSSSSCCACFCLCSGRSLRGGCSVGRAHWAQWPASHDDSHASCNGCPHGSHGGSSRGSQPGSGEQAGQLSGQRRSSSGSNAAALHPDASAGSGHGSSRRQLSGRRAAGGHAAGRRGGHGGCSGGSGLWL